MATQRKPTTGELDRRVTLWTNEPTTATDGQRVEGPVEKTKRWAKIRATGGSEQAETVDRNADTTHAVVVRYGNVTKTLDPTWWLTLRDGTRLDIVSAFDPWDSREWIELKCNERK